MHPHPTPRSPLDAVNVLLTAIRVALDGLTNLRLLPPAILEGAVEANLRHALAVQPDSRLDPGSPGSLAAAAARTACAHLAAHAWTDALQALHAAHDHLARAAPRAAGGVASRDGTGGRRPEG